MQNYDYLRVKNFERYQHYSKRKPPWIKLYFSLLSDPDFVGMTDASKLHTIAIMLLASQYDNKIPFNKAWIQRAIFANTRINWNEVLSSGFVICYQDASTMLATRKHVASTDTEVQKYRSTEVQNIGEHDSVASIFTELPCTGPRKSFSVTNEYVEEMKNLYPGIDIEKETLAAKAWLINNPTKAKTYSGITKYLGNWYSRAQNNGHHLQNTNSSSNNVSAKSPEINVGESEITEKDETAVQKALEIRRQRGLDGGI